MSLVVLGWAKSTSGKQSINKSVETLLWDRFNTAGLRPKSAIPPTPCWASNYSNHAFSFITFLTSHRYLSSVQSQINFLWDSLTHCIKWGWLMSRALEHQNTRINFHHLRREQARINCFIVACQLIITAFNEINSAGIMTSSLPGIAGWLQGLRLGCLDLRGGHALSSTQQNCDAWTCKQMAYNTMQCMFNCVQAYINKCVHEVFKHSYNHTRSCHILQDPWWVYLCTTEAFHILTLETCKHIPYLRLLVRSRAHDLVNI